MAVSSFDFIWQQTGNSRLFKRQALFLVLFVTRLPPNPTRSKRCFLDKKTNFDRKGESAESSKNFLELLDWKHEEPHNSKLRSAAKQIFSAMTDFKQTFFPEFCAIGRTKAKTDKAEEWQKLNDRLEEFNVDFCNQATDNFSDELLNTLIGLQADDLQARLSLLGMNVSHLSKPNRLSAYIIHLTDNYSLPQCYVEVQQNGSYTVKIGVPAPAEHEDETHDQETETKEPTSVDSDELLKKIEATVIAVMNARSNHDTSRVLPRVPAFKSAGPPKVVKRGWQEMESSARLAHQCSSTPRISRLASLLGNPKAPMQLEPQDKDVLGKFFRSGLDDEVNSLPFSNPALLPSTAISSEDEVKALLQHSVDHVGKKRKFKDADEFHRAMSIDMRKALERPERF